ncbi:hypothetical protein SHKM778_74770 [Streptomyces sp. KM77-8]|uniref:Uncharacterized protein n=1 Tax=Streptomyces haneummycinicus TaxID=3074435 RepID=A0AAT9HUX4_9ACTN
MDKARETPIHLITLLFLPGWHRIARLAIMREGRVRGARMITVGHMYEHSGTRAARPHGPVRALSAAVPAPAVIGGLAVWRMVESTGRPLPGFAPSLEPGEAGTHREKV